ncbi:hypothetical protein AWB85_06400 [Mycobacteroides immunogenum]|uniref:EXLDI protein n=1 Tax=Mycobacteroides immunogenum TaxID=83262 RepID=A0A179VGN9_9MYCO|nr:EXLDI protein [Mycobacteroides immunogenum]OAT70904.1 hypothetical protein AWB85_06400 [Mycobacteroides immunogenum]
MPNKTIYVSDNDAELYRRAQEIAGGNLSAAISAALKRYVELEDAHKEGYDEITVRVGAGTGRKQRFVGILLGEWGAYTSKRVTVHRVYRSRSGKFVIQVTQSPDWTMGGGWRSYIGIGDQTWGYTQEESRLEVVDTLEELNGKIPPELFTMVSSTANEPAVEDLDI